MRMLDLRSTKQKEVARVAELVARKFSSYETCEGIVIDVPVVGDEGFEFGVEGFEVDAGVCRAVESGLEGCFGGGGFGGRGRTAEGGEGVGASEGEGVECFLHCGGGEGALSWAHDYRTAKSDKIRRFSRIVGCMSCEAIRSC